MSTETTIPPAPRKEDFPDPEAFGKAYRRWWKRYHYDPTKKNQMQELLLGFEECMYFFNEVAEEIPEASRQEFLAFLKEHPYLYALFKEYTKKYAQSHQYTGGSS